jgi:hypothetical protein
MAEFGGFESMPAVDVPTDAHRTSGTVGPGPAAPPKS